MTETSVSPRPFTSVWSDLQEVEFSQGFIQAGPYRTRYLHAGDTSKPTLVHVARDHRPRRGLRPEPALARGALLLLGHRLHRPRVQRQAGPPAGDQALHRRRCSPSWTPSACEKAYFTGESLGGWVTAQLAIDHPDRVERIVLNTMGGTMANPQVMERLYTLSMEAAKDPCWERVKARLEWLMADPTMVTDDLIKTRQAIFQQPDWLQACEANMALQNPEIRKRNMLTDDALGRIKAPALVLWTTKDPSGPVTEAQRITSLIPGAKLAVMENCGHWPQYEDTETFMFLKSKRVVTSREAWSTAFLTSCMSTSETTSKVGTATRYRRSPGSVPEWPKGADCKSAGTAYGGSNPPRPTVRVRMHRRRSMSDKDDAQGARHSGRCSGVVVAGHRESVRINRRDCHRFFFFFFFFRSETSALKYVDSGVWRTVRYFFRSPKSLGPRPFQRRSHWGGDVW